MFTGKINPLPKSTPTLISIFVAFVFLSIVPNISRGQSIDSVGKFVPPDTNILYNPNINLKDAIPRYNKNDTATIRKILLGKINRTIFRITNDSTNLRSSYREIWGECFITKYLANLNLIRNYLKTPGDFKGPEEYLPKISHLQTLLKPAALTIDQGIIKESTKEFLVLQKDTLASYLFNQYKKDYEADTLINKAEINSAYLNDWRKLEKWYALTNILDKKISTAEQNLFNFDEQEISLLKTEVDLIKPKNLGLVKMIDRSTFVRNWLWFNEGTIRMNPLASTTPEKRYPNDEPNLFFGPVQKKLQDSLEKLKAYDVFRMTTKTFNKIILPVKIPEKNPDTLMVQYNMQENELVTLVGKKLKDGYIKNGIQLVLPVYNIPAEKTVLLTTEKKPLIYESRAISEINIIAENIGGITTLGLSNSAAIGKITDLLNPTHLPNVEYNIQSKTPSDSEKFANQQKGFETLKLPKISGFVNQPVTSILIEGIWVPLTNKYLKEDKKRILWTSQLGKQNINELKDTSPFFEKLFSEFVDADQYFFLDYSSLFTIEPGIQKMMGRFNAFKDKIRKRAEKIKELKEQNFSNNRMLIAYLRISNRSLPPKILQEKTDTTAQYYTKIFVPEMPAAPQKFSYTLSEGTVGSTKLKQVAKSDFKLVKTRRFDLSVGLGYTFSDYNLTSNTGSDLPTSELGDKFQFQAGLHWYFIHRLNKLNDKLFRNTDERFSLYAGLSLKKALENYYTGISYDVTPGVRLIAGAHFYKNNRFKIINNAVAEKASGISFAGIFTSLNLEPVTIGKAIGLFK